VKGRRLDQGEAANAIGPAQSQLKRDGGAEGVPNHVHGLPGPVDQSIKGGGHWKKTID